MYLNYSLVSAIGSRTCTILYNLEYVEMGYNEHELQPIFYALNID